MSFGGENSSTGVSAHVHSNSTGEGGSLNVTETLISETNLYTRILIGV
tara:strand:+ start:154 stop:297 length:144 start_codon:yes stop_codon:yes gene_type:complete